LYSIIMSRLVVRLEKFANRTARWVTVIAGIALVLMLAITIADIVGIKIFSQPVPGAIEIIGYLGVLVTAFAISYTLVERAHVQVEFFVDRMPPRIQSAVSALVSLLSFGLFSLLAWRSFEYARIVQTTGQVSMTQRIPFHPFIYAIAFCCIPICLVILSQFLRSVLNVVKK